MSEFDEKPVTEPNGSLFPELKLSGAAETSKTAEPAAASVTELDAVQTSEEVQPKKDYSGFFNSVESEKTVQETSAVIHQRQKNRMVSGSLGEMLGELRRQNGYEPEEVFEETNISVNHIKALESDNFQRLPKAIYAISIVNALGKFYHATVEEMTLLNEEANRNFHTEIQVSGVKLRDISSDPDEKKRVKQLALGLLIGIILLVLVVITGIVILVFSLRAGNRDNQSFDDSVLIELPGRQKLDLPIVEPQVPRR